MILRRTFPILTILASLWWAIPAQAQGLFARFRAFSESVVQDYRRNNCWPEPFIRPDRQAVRLPFALMVHNGWRRQNMLSEHHFGEDGATLNEGGHMKIRWIVTEAPRQHRTIYVHRTLDPEQTAARIKAVQESAMQFAADGERPRVLETSIPVEVEGWSATQVDAINRAWERSTPAPRLPEESTADASEE